MIRKILYISLFLLCLGCEKTYEEYYILNIQDNKVTLAPSNYDKDAKEMFKDDIIIKELAKSVTYKDIFIYTHIKNNEEKRKTTTKKITLDEIKEAVEYDYAYVRITFDKNDKINSITLWGETIVYE